MTLGEYLAGRTPEQQEVIRAAIESVADLDDVDVEPVHVGILVRRGRTFAELRPRRRGMALSLILARRLDHGRVTRVLRSGSRWVHFVPLDAARDVDDEVRAWIDEAYAETEA